ncbi:MAG: hypothetical protein AB8G22_07645 [Saprospiraceae bacterium]
MSKKHKNIIYTIFSIGIKPIEQSLLDLLSQLKSSYAFYALPFILSFFFLFTSTQHAYAYISPVYITVKQDTLSAKPGKVITTSLNITNDSAHEFTLQPEVKAPQGWKVITQKNSFKLTARKSQLKLVSIKIPQNTIAQQFPLHYYLTTDKQDTIAHVVLTVAVEAERIISIKPIEAPQFVMAGGAFTATFLVQNDGNVTDELKLKSRNCDIVSEKTISLTPGQSQHVKVTASTSEEIRKLTRFSFWVEAQHKSKKVAESYHFVRVIPILPETKDEYRNLPAQLRLTYFGRERGKGFEDNFQGELQIRGKIDSAETKEIAIGIRAPNQADATFAGQPDEYFASYTTPTLHAFIGDKTFSLSPMTEFARYARGIEASVRRGKEELGAFYERPRFFPEIEHEIGAYLRHHTARKGFYSFNFLNKKYVEQPEDVLLFSNYNLIHLAKHTTLTSDIALDANGGWGSFLNITSQPSTKFNISSTLLLASKHFQGFHKNTQNLSGNVGYRITPNINLLASLSQDDRNAKQDTLFNNAPLTRRWQAGANTRINEKTRLRIYYQQYELEDRMPTKYFHRQENTYRLFILRQENKINWTLLNEIGNSINLSSPDRRKSDIYRSSLKVTYKPSRRLSIQAFTQFFNRRYREENKRQLIYGATVRATLPTQTTIKSRFQSNYVIEEYYRDRNLFELSVQQQIKKQHRLSINYRYALLRQTLDRKDYNLAVNYTYRFGIPIEKRIKKGDLHGQIVNAGVEKVSGIILTLAGRTTITDENGHFTFQKVPSGKHYLILDRSTMGMHDIVEGKSPIMINMPTGRDTSVQLTMIQGAQVAGKIVFEQSDKSLLSFQSDKFPFAGTLVELRSETETVRQLTDEKGHFSIQNLQPGEWTFSVVLNQSHKNLKFDRTSIDLKIEAGQKEEITITAKQKKRQIRFQKSGSLPTLRGDDDDDDDD